MARESIEERRARLMPGARWIRAERERRDWSGRELARRMDVAQDRVSAYERAQDEPPPSFARALAEVFEMPEIEVWRHLRLPLPAQARTDEDVVAWAYEVDAGLIERVVREVTGHNPPPRPPNPGRKSPGTTRTGENKAEGDDSQQDAV